MIITNGQNPGTAARAFSTFEVARICGAYHTTVINWVNKGLLKARHTPGGHRRIALPDLLDFMRRFEMPIPEDLVSRAQRVLVVEDDPSVQRMLLRTLQGVPEIKTQACFGGLEALISIGKEPPDLLVLDIRIPQVNGLEVCRVLKASESTRPIRIIAITGETLSQDEEGFLRQHADRLLHKPLSTEEFRRQVSELLELESRAAGS